MIARVAPEYPEAARQAGIQGTVMVQVRVCDRGLIDSTIMVQSIPELDQSAVMAIRQWVSKPATANHQPVTVWVAIPVRYTLHWPAVVAGPVAFRTRFLDPSPVSTR